MYKLKGSITIHDKMDEKKHKTITDEAVYEIIKRHSRLIDRLNPKKMFEMAVTAEAFAANDELKRIDNDSFRFYK